MKHVNLIYKLDGIAEKINNGLNIFELAPILLSVGELVRESNKTLYPDGKELAVNVKPFRQGSFIIDIVIFSQNKLQELLQFANQDGVKQIKELLEWIGIIGGATSSLWHLIRFLKGKPKSVEQLAPNEVRYTDQHNNSVTVPKEVHQLFQNCLIQNVIYNAFGKPLEQEGVTKVETYLEESATEKVVFEKGEAEYLKDYSESEIPTLDLEEVIANSMQVFLVPKRGSFDGDPRQWSFRMNESIITATIKDGLFLEKIKTGEIRPNHTDVLQVVLVQKIKKVNGRLDPNSVVFEVEKVLEYQRNNTSTQTNMKFPE